MGGGVNVKVTRFHIDYNRLSYNLCQNKKSVIDEGGDIKGVRSNFFLLRLPLPPFLNIIFELLETHIYFDIKKYI